MTSSNKTKLLAGVVIFGTVATAALAFNAGMHFYDDYVAYRMNEGLDNDVYNIYKKKIIKNVVPPVISLGATIASTWFFGKHCNNIEERLLSKLYLAEKQLSRLSDSVLDDAPLDDVVNWTKLYSYPETFFHSPDCEVLLLEPWTDQLIPTTLKKVDKAVENANKRLQNNYIVSLNSFIKDLGGEVTEFGAYLFWMMDDEEQMKKWKKSGGPYIDILLDREYELHGRKIQVISYPINPVRMDD